MDKVETTVEAESTRIGCVIDQATRQLVWSVPGEGTVCLRLGMVSKENLDYAIYHGLKQDVGDRKAISRDSKTGLSATGQTKLAAMKARVDYLESGAKEWSEKRAGRVSDDAVMLVKCLTELRTDRTQAQILVFVSTLDKDTISGLLASDKVKVIADRIRAAGVVTTIDADKLLATL